MALDEVRLFFCVSVSPRFIVHLHLSNVKSRSISKR
jgi:hypothetical protein